MSEDTVPAPEATHLPPADEQRSRRPTGLVVAAVAAIGWGFVLRLWVVNGSLGSINADEAVSGLMARALLDGDVSTFYWEQHYGGTIEILPLAALVATIGDDAALVVMPILESLLIGWLTYVLVRRRLDRQLALATVALAAVFPAASVWFTTRAMLFYQPTVILGLAALVLVDHLTEDDHDRRGRLIRTGLLGLALGLGWWTSSQILFFAVPAIGWLAFRRALRPGFELLALPAGAIVGAAPWLLHNVRTSGASLTELPGGHGSYVDHLQTQFELGWPMVLGLRRPFTEAWIASDLSWLLVAAGVAVAAAVVTTFVRHRALVCPLVLVLVAFPLIHALAPSSYYVGTGRYYLFVMPSVAYALVATVSIWRHANRWAAGVLVAAAALTTWTLYDLRHVHPGSADIPELAEALDERGVDDVYANYWTGYMLAWKDDDLAVTPDIFDRRPDWSADVRSADDVAYVFDMSAATERARYDDLVPRLVEHVGVDEEFDVAGYRVVVPVDNVPPELLPPLGADE